jgi:RNA polymerase sigma-70 factor (ECF subfamily)
MGAITAVPNQGSDAELGLVAAAAAGDAAAFGRLYHRYSSSVYNLVLRSVRDKHLAEDLCQDVWVKAYRQLSSLREIAAFPTWLYRIAARACVDAARKRASRPATSELTDQLAASTASDPESSAMQGEQARLTWEALAALPIRQHQALFLKEVEGQSYREIAQVLETTESAVETLLFRARRGFADAFEQLRSGRADRCGQARAAMSSLFDGEGTPVQRQAVQAHIDGCESCRQEVFRAQRTSFAYAALPLMPASPLLAESVLGSIGVASTSAGAGGLIAKLLALGGGSAKPLLAALTLTSGLGAASLVAPYDAPAASDVPQPAAAARQGADAHGGFEVDDNGPSAYGSGHAANTGAGVAAQPDADGSVDAVPPGSDEARALVSSLVVTVQRALAGQGPDAPAVPAVDQAIGTVEETVDGTLNEATGALQPVNDAVGGVTGDVQPSDPPASDASGDGTIDVNVPLPVLPALPTPAGPSLDDILGLP